MKKSRLNLNELKVRSFITTLRNSAYIKSGRVMSDSKPDGSEVDDSFTDSTPLISVEPFKDCNPRI
ncbi:pinensin family lanthipeptide [Fulvivirga ulvae]|uniref:pinensin family lanthipeptide n=1 Tax=Fulvivirga ulvae TaxID=2904245 RepID=UPI001F33B7B0|nr:pinensin family lanthipeptide [Fulvivirga ulvae]UII30236.1 pinensin family lanthipeptide [Fulvivirga ulvae]